MGYVIQRLGHEISEGGEISYDDRPATYEQAESIIGRRLDRRKNFAIIDGQVMESCRFSAACSGCYEGHNIEHGRGNGCDECGYTGRRRQGYWLPFYDEKDDD